ncbi:bifunctional DNA-formamidopyrimidine glycosylase/DNA-(apurinic or apyrimidinic site) lyase [Sandaracinobacter neustonicus]|uniref:Formamidopyrimidine-DNA glycosylase n=1 Tax=Sandaracinobacter neustonicus TaxID=1715348 RepID=A0A501XNG7_9SPHN|nr:bifunctional DNA-formamidopyrimidine glycosylase/DNA-(apurinic or apyrimidinic site) lyase [Sandaracinobacter neustonicus]TPE61834.1 bifunctional DNA-formamidopyrimidine glycosylase/DNA-(apurinic or apyrimidinic site) lyase [Sandaracinobacter neustonicus]
MPELPEVETVVRGLSPLLLNRRLTRVTARRPDLRWPLPDDLAQRLSGATVTALHRRAKYGLMETDRGDTLIFHLGMSGKFHQLAAEPGAHDHVLFVLDDLTLAYNDHRRFGSMHLTPTPEAARHPLLARLGPEPLSEAFSPQSLAASAKNRATSIKALILDQQTVAGIGNIYACEALFQARIDPTQSAGTLKPKQLAALVEALKATLAGAIEAGGSTLRDHAQVSGDLGYFQHSFQVYGREGQPCPMCGGPVRRRVQGGRSTFDCPLCQR